MLTIQSIDALKVAKSDLGEIIYRLSESPETATPEILKPLLAALRVICVKLVPEGYNLRAEPRLEAMYESMTGHSFREGYKAA
jgi:hypothetical protein